ncbi:unnamed protein product [Pelagomonas calceolata]|uniref:SGNH hydrolase-type esterase domain-containing protein n=1 Tax=Pelagomonas calceolata TaxID=35677 RepID=A0A8J2T1U5_9STRA|nr:unnamed protein product [Pelagomonas calceolata]
MARRMTPCKLLLLATCCVGAQDCSQMTFNPNTVVDPVAKYAGRRCRGWPLLAKHFGVEARATAVVDRCGVGDEKQPCGFDVIDCAKRRRLGGVRVLVTLTGSNVIDAATAERVDDDTLRVRWVPPEAGTYEVSAILNWLYQVAAPQVDAYPSRGHPVYLGPTENRCPGGRCGRAQPFTLDECAKVATVPFAPKTFTVVEAPSPKKPLAPCRDPGPGHWRRSADGWAFARGDCAVRRFPGPAAEACLARRRVKVVTFLGDSLVRDAWAAFGRRLNITVNERKVRARRFAGAASTVASAKGLWRCGLLPRNLACCGFEPAAAGERGPDAVELFGAALPPGPGEVLVVANFGILHMPASAGDPNKFEARTKHALRRLDKISRAAGLSVTVLLVAPPTLRGLRSPGLHPAQLEAFAPAMRRLATEGLGVSVRVLDLAPLSAARADASFDGLHYVREVPAAAVDAALGMLCEL